MNADRRNTLIAASIAFGLNLRARRSHGTVCWGLRDTAAQLAEALRLGPRGTKPVIAASLGAISVAAYHHLAAPLKELL